MPSFADCTSAGRFQRTERGKKPRKTKTRPNKQSSLKPTQHAKTVQKQNNNWELLENSREKIKNTRRPFSQAKKNHLKQKPNDLTTKTNCQSKHGSFRTPCCMRPRCCASSRASLGIATMTSQVQCVRILVA